LLRTARNFSRNLEGLVHQLVCRHAQTHQPDALGFLAIDKIGGDVSPPVLIHAVKPEFPEEARNARLRAQVLVNLYVDKNGKPSNVHMIRITSIDKKGRPTTESIDPRVGKGLSEKATEAVKQYKFKPSTKNGNPVKVELNVVVDFQIF